MKKTSIALLAVTVLLLELLVFPAAAEESTSAKLVGSWRLVSWINSDGSPRCTQDEGPASGEIIYSADGHMSAQLGCAEISINVAEEESLQALSRKLSRRHLSYYGPFTVDETAHTVTHHVAGSSILNDYTGSNQVRSYTFETNDRLVLQPPGGARLTWLRN